MDCCCSQLCVAPVISASHARHTLAPELVRTFQILKHLYNDEENDADLGLYDAFKADAWGVGAILYYAATGHHLVPDFQESGCRCSSTSSSNGSGKIAAESKHASDGQLSADSASVIEVFDDSYLDMVDQLVQYHSRWQVRQL